ncbi:MAG: hypothetical protein Q8P36_00625, partial [bacterium]|nr:hypothetical protein [bacterium]
TAMPPWPLERSEPIPPTSPWAPPPPQATDGHGTKGAVPMNLPTGIPLPPAPRPAPAESFYEFPPLARPVPPPLSSIPDGNTPHTRYPSDPYREQPE